MIRGFKPETDVLSDYEKEKYLPQIVSILEQRKGKGNSLSNKKILSMMANHDNLDNQVISIASDIHAAEHRCCSPWWVALQKHRRRIHLRKG